MSQQSKVQLGPEIEALLEAEQQRWGGWRTVAVYTEPARVDEAHGPHPGATWIALQTRDPYAISDALHMPQMEALLGEDLGPSPPLTVDDPGYLWLVRNGMAIGLASLDISDNGETGRSELTTPLALYELHLAKEASSDEDLLAGALRLVAQVAAQRMADVWLRNINTIARARSSLYGPAHQHTDTAGHDDVLMLFEGILATRLKALAGSMGIAFEMIGRNRTAPSPLRKEKTAVTQ